MSPSERFSNRSAGVITGPHSASNACACSLMISCASVRPVSNTGRPSAAGSAAASVTVGYPPAAVNTPEVATTSGLSLQPIIPNLRFWTL